MKYQCDNCGREVGRDNLVTKRVGFHKMGKGGKLIRQRTVAWLCRDRCLGEDPAWNKQPFATQEKQKKEYEEQQKKAKA